MGFKGKDVFIIYLNDDNRQVSAYVSISDIKDGLISFKTNNNLIAIPTSRIIKIKEKIAGAWQ